MPAGLVNELDRYKVYKMSSKNSNEICNTQNARKLLILLGPTVPVIDENTMFFFLSEVQCFKPISLQILLEHSNLSITYQS